MVKKFVFILLILLLICASTVNAEFELNGSIYDINGNPLNYTTIKVILKNSSWSQISENFSYSNSSGLFAINLSGNSSDNYFYQLSVYHLNSSTNAIDWVGQSLPLFPYSEFSQLSNITFYLREAGTINISARNSTNSRIQNNQFAYKVKDQKLGYEISSCNLSGNYNALCYVPRDRNYSIMIYPSDGSPEHFIPVSFNWNNFSSASSYNIDSISEYNFTTKTMSKEFNLSISFAWIQGFINGSHLGIRGWDEMAIVPFLLEPGNLISIRNGVLQYNLSSWRGTVPRTDIYLPDSNGFFNITLPYYPAETINFLLFATARNGSFFYGAYRNITVSGGTNNFDFRMYGLLGENSTINMTKADSGNFQINTSKKSFNLVNSTSNLSLQNLNAHVELKVDYSNYNATEFTFIDEIYAQTSSISANFSIPLLNITGVKEMNVYSQNFAPRRVSSRSISQISQNNNISLNVFNPIDIQRTLSKNQIRIYIYKSNSSCDVPSPHSSCELVISSNLSDFRPLSTIIGGGRISFRMGMPSGALIHYANVDMLASGPPDALFDNNHTETSLIGTFKTIMKFGSNGPKIYDHILVSIPYSEGNSTQLGFNETVSFNMSIPLLYDEDWNVVWNISNNGSSGSALAGNFSYYSNSSNEWQTLMGNNTCTSNVSNQSSTNPCYIDTESNRIWVRLPHFSGTEPLISGMQFTDTVSPSITDIENSSINSSSVTITWTTNEPANSTIHYGETTATNSKSQNSSLEVSHSIIISGLDSVTDYYFNITSCDYRNNCNTSRQYSFITGSSISNSTDSSSSGAGASFTNVTQNLTSDDPDFWTRGTRSVSDEEFSNGYTQRLQAKERFRVLIDNEYHYVGIINISGNTATINVSSTPQQANFNIGDEKKFEINEDNYYDLYVKLNGIEENQANLTIGKINEMIEEATPAVLTSSENSTIIESQEEKISDKKALIKLIVTIILIIALVGIISAIVYFVWKKRKEGF
ncbi:MAG: hypothetical protein ACOYT4_04905 [Nanoarchaeota archaeon]